MSLATLTHQALRDPSPPFRYQPPPAAPARDHLRAVPATAPGPLGTTPRTVSENLGVPTLHRTVVDYANFDHAASTPALESVKAAVDVALRTYSSVHRGNGYASKVTSGWYEEARAEVGAFVGARADDLVVFTRNTTDSLNLLGRSLPARHDHVRLRDRAPRRAAAVEPPPHGAPARPRQRRRRAGAARRRARRRPRRPAAGRRRRRLQRHRRAVAGRRARRPGPARTAPGWPWTPRSSPRTSPSTSPRSASTSSPSPATSSTPRSAPACSSAAPTGSTPRRRTCAAAAPRRR